MRLKLKDGYQYDKSGNVARTTSAFNRFVATPYGDVPGFGELHYSDKLIVFEYDASDWRECAHKAAIAAGRESFWEEAPTDAEITAAAEGEGPVAPVAPAPRLCAVDRLEAAGYVTKICDGWIAFYSTSHGMTVSIKPTRRAGYFQAKGALGTTGDESPGLNAALESLLAKPVGAVTVAQILGVAP